MAKQREERRKAPGVDMLAFSSIMTIMLAFFIMLASFIKEQKAELLMRASASFRSAVAGFGLNSFIERIAGENTVRDDLPKTKQSFSARPVENIHLSNDVNDNNILEEDIEFENISPLSETYIQTLVGFEKGDYKLNEDAKNKLDEFISLLADRPSRIIVEGRADGDEMYGKSGYKDWYLSSFRAHSVAEYLNVKGGIDARRISVVGYGRHRPLVEKVNLVGSNSFVGLTIIN